jgi:hypothetical protein
MATADITIDPDLIVDYIQYNQLTSVDTPRLPFYNLRVFAMCCPMRDFPICAAPKKTLSIGPLISRIVTCTILSLVLSCGSSSHLQSIQITTAAPQGFDVIGLGGTIQLIVTGIYSDGHMGVLTERATYASVMTPGSLEGNGTPLPIQGVLEVSTTGLVTAVYPAVCTWANLASAATAPPAVWSVNGSYQITATAYNITSAPVYVTVASGPGIITPSNPTGVCGPQPSSS